MSLLPVENALGLLLAGAGPRGAERLAISRCAGRVLAGPVTALRTQPPFPASAMDGYAVRAADVAEPPARLRVIGQAPAGTPYEGRVGPGEAVRIFTGAPVPEGADSVLIQENTRLLGDGLVEAVAGVAEGRNIRRKGLDFEKGEPLLDAGRELDAAALSLAAAANHAELDVVRRPRVGILATGDELLPPGSAEIGPGRIIASNVYGIAALVEAAGGEALDLGIARDDRAIIAGTIDRAVDAGADVIVTIGGASVGDHDLVRDVLQARGASMDFWKIAMRPGKPLMAGSLGAARIVGLPGNPVASLVCGHVFLKPLVAALAGRAHAAMPRDGVAGAPLAANDLRQDYLRAVAREEDGRLVAYPSVLQDSSMLKVLADANCLIVRPPFAPACDAGAPCRLVMLR